MGDEIDDSALVMEADPALVIGVGVRVGLGAAQIAEPDAETLVEERHHLEAIDERLSPEIDVFEDARIRPEAHRGAGSATR